MAGVKRRVWVKEPGKNVRHVAISDTLKNLQNYVGGYLELYPIGTDAAIICNEEGRLLNLDENVYIMGCQFCGTIILIGINGEEFANFPIQDVKEMKRMFPQLWEENHDREYENMRPMD